MDNLIGAGKEPHSHNSRAKSSSDTDGEEESRRSHYSDSDVEEDTNDKDEVVIEHLRAKHDKIFRKILAQVIEHKNIKHKKAKYRYKIKLEETTHHHKEEVQLLRDTFSKIESHYKDEIQRLKKELSEKTEMILCQLCRQRVRDCLLTPCGHLLYCFACIERRRQQSNEGCPKCEAPITVVLPCRV